MSDTYLKVEYVAKHSNYQKKLMHKLCLLIAGKIGVKNLKCLLKISKTLRNTYALFVKSRKVGVKNLKCLLRFGMNKMLVG